jgi:hypothetical protein
MTNMSEFPKTSIIKELPKSTTITESLKTTNMVALTRELSAGPLNPPTFTENFDADNWIDADDTKIGVDVGNSRLSAQWELDTSNDASYLDVFGVNFSETQWTIRFSASIDKNNELASFNHGFIELSSTIGNSGTTVSDSIGIWFEMLFAPNQRNVHLVARDNQSGVGTPQQLTNFDFTDGVTYYYQFERLSDTSCRLSVFTDANYTNHVTDSPQTIAISSSLQSLRYLKVSNWQASQSNISMTALIDNVEIWNGRNA